MQRIFVLALLAGAFISCRDDSFEPEKSFLKILDSNSSQVSYNPIDVAQTETGFLVLAANQPDKSDFSGVQVIQLDEAGGYVGEVNSESYVAPVGDIIGVDSMYYFFAMDEASSSPMLFSVGTNLSGFNTPVSLNLGVVYPLAASINANNQLIFLGYNVRGLQFLIARVGLDGAVLNSRSYDIGTGSDVEQYVINHLVDPERSALPFFCGELSTGQVYYNGYYDNSLSLVFSSFRGRPDGVLYGQGVNNGGLTMALPVLGSDFAIMGFQYSERFLDPHVTLNTSADTTSIDLIRNVSEFKPNSKSDIAVWSYGGVRYVIMAAETYNSQVALYFYDYESRELRGIENVGNNNAFLLSSIKVDRDNGLLVLGSTYVSGRFKRPFLKKFTEKELSEVIR